MNKTEELLENLEQDYKDNIDSIKQTFKRIKKKTPKNLDYFVQEKNDEVFEVIDCLSCGACCKELGPRITDHDVQRMAKGMKMKPSKFTEQYLKMDDDDYFAFNEMPCPFLMPDNYCMVYEHRPKACREYPHTDRRKFSQLLQLTELNIKTCPAAMEVSKAIVKEFGNIPVKKIRTQK
ncbi:MAG: YkgJ family cysteine cluster protein [Bacteroidales bacterium]|nr:YkgJ family cysteine cluster protein [Bacteroidales bacterium]